jgi:hypothetical protein
MRAAVLRANGVSKRPAVAALLRAERTVAEAALLGALRSIEAQVEELLDAARSPTLFGERRGLGRLEREQLAGLRQRRQQGRERLRALLCAGEVPWFHYATHFADVQARGGFDLVVGNPPWVRAEALEPGLRRYLAERFRWFRGGRGITRGYSHLPDLAVAFLERALDLVAPDGVVALLVPAKLATTGYASVVREELARKHTIALAADLQNDPRSAFDATVYPMALVVRRSPPRQHHEVRLGLDPDGERIPQRELGAAAWALLPKAARGVLLRVSQEFPALGQRFRCHLGVKTGLNRVFLDPPASVEPELIRWAVRGRDVRAFRVRRARRLLWPCDDRGQALERLPPGAAAYLGPELGDLRRRADHRPGPAWTLFRTRPATAPHRVIWSDVARRLQAAALSGARDVPLVPLNTCYLVPTSDAGTALRVTAWLNSTWCRAIALACADPASGGFRRFNARVVAGLPCPDAVLQDPALPALARAGMTGTLAQEELDDRCAALLELRDSEQRALAELDCGRAKPGG